MILGDMREIFVEIDQKFIVVVNFFPPSTTDDPVLFADVFFIDFVYLRYISFHGKFNNFSLNTVYELTVFSFSLVFSVN